MVDVSTTVAGAVLHQRRGMDQRRYSTFGREPLPVYLAKRHFQHYVEGLNMLIFTDHLALALRNHFSRCSHREVHQLYFLSQQRFCTSVPADAFWNKTSIWNSQCTVSKDASGRQLAVPVPIRTHITHFFCRHDPTLKLTSTLPFFTNHPAWSFVVVLTAHMTNKTDFDTV